MKTTTILLSLASSLLLVSNGSAFVVKQNAAVARHQLSMRTNDASEETFNGWYKGYYECIYNIPTDYPHGKPILPWDRTQVDAARPMMTTSAASPAASSASSTPADAASSKGYMTPETASVSYKNVPDRVPM